MSFWTRFQPRQNRLLLPSAQPSSSLLSRCLAAEQDARVAREELALLKEEFRTSRLQAEKRRAQERTTLLIEILLTLLPALDDLGRAFKHTPADISEHPWVQGMRLATQGLVIALAHLGLRRFGTAGELFDPHRHDAIATAQRPGVPEGTILQVERPGYLFGNKLLQPALVVVASAK